jgi:polyvinyl alcohol dehydrogenase (cytochrome)
MKLLYAFISLLLLFGSNSQGQQSSLPLLVARSANDTPENGNSGEKLFVSTCKSCHENPSQSAPSLSVLGAMTPRAVFAALKTGKMRAQAASLSDEDRKLVAEWITKQTYQETRLPASAFVPMTPLRNAAVYSGWGGNLAGTGFVSQSALTPANVGTLKVKWAFAFPEGTQVRSKPAVVGDWLVVGSQYGDVYAIKKQTGKVGWHFSGDAAIRGAIFIGQAKSGPVAYFADFTTNVYAVDVQTGKLIWKKRAGGHPQSSNTGSVTVHQDKVIVPISSAEVSLSKDPNYPCCSSSGEVVALSAVDGEILWRHRVIPDEAKPGANKKNGLPFFGPSGAPVWSSPTIDTKRGLVYFGTGENYTYPASATSDAIHAVDLKTGKLVWSYQATQDDTWNLDCPDGPNCPEKVGPDVDFGMAPLLVTLASGEDMLVAGQKSGVVHALDPATGKIHWQTRIGKGGMLGGIHWGMAADNKYVYAANSDHSWALDTRDSTQKPSPGLYALDLLNGKVAWHQPTPACNVPPDCLVANSAAPVALPGVVFAGGLDGHIRAYSSADGRILWDYDTVRDYQTSNGIIGKGGSLDGPAPVMSGGMIFVNSGYGLFGQIPGNVLIAFELEKP